MKAARGMAVALVALCFFGCARTVSFVRPTPPPTPDELMAALEKRQQALRTVNLETRTTSWLGGDRARATVLMLVDRAGRLRFEAEVSLQGTVAALAVANDQFTLLDMREKRFQTGPACPAHVASLIRIPLRPEEIAAILLGDAPLGSGARPVGVTWDKSWGVELLEIARLGDFDATTRLWIAFRALGSGSWDVVGVEGQSAASKGRWRVIYEEMATTDGIRIPSLIRFAEPGKSFDDGVEIKIKDRVVNPALEDASFRIVPPSDYPQEIVSCSPNAP